MFAIAYALSCHNFELTLAKQMFVVTNEMKLIGSVTLPDKIYIVIASAVGKGSKG